MNDDKAVGAEIKALREAIGMSQADLANHMSDAGFQGFYPQTIVKIEKGQRTVKFAEGLAIAYVFGVDPATLMGEQMFSEEDMMVRRLVRALESAYERADRAFQDVRQADSNLSDLLDQLNIGEEGEGLWLRQVLRHNGAEATARRFTIMADQKPTPRPPALGE